MATETRSGVRYVRETVPPVPIPSFPGELYAARVPDTLDLAERARLALNVLTRATNPDADHETYFVLHLKRRPIVMFHEWSDYIGSQPKYLEALPLMRLMTGSDLNMDVEQRMVEVGAHMTGEDGIYYLPIEGRPWALRDSLGNPATEDPSVLAAGQHADSYANARFLLAMTLWYLRDGNPFWRDCAERMIRRYGEIAVQKDDYAYFPEPFSHPGFLVPGQIPDRDSPPGRSFTHVGTIHALARYFEATGHEPALELAGKLSRYMSRHSGEYEEDGRFRGHFHCNTYGLLGMLEYALIVGDTDLIELVRRGYEYGRAIGSATTGFFPEHVDRSYPTAETCEIANMIALAIQLSSSAVGDYWDDADRYVRNQFAENQMLDHEWLYEAAEEYPERPVEAHETAEDVGPRSVGGFAGWPLANDFWSGDRGPSGQNGFVFMHCCTGNGARALYYVWKSILDYANGRLRVNLLLNRASASADVDSHLPYQGRVDVRMKQECALEVRIPEWVAPEQARCEVNGASRQLEFDGRYAQVGALRQGDVASLSFPIGERTSGETIGGVDYALTIKGNSVVNTDPAGTFYPYYQRSGYREGDTRWRDVSRFVSSEDLAW